MSTVAATEVSWKPKKGALPPWIVLALVLSVLGLPTQVQLLLSDWGPTTSVLSNQLLWLTRVPIIVDLAMALALYAGVAIVFLPWVRRTVFVERKYQVRDWEDARANPREVLSEIHDFLQVHAPGVCLKYAERLSDKAMEYPADYHRTIIAVSPAMLDLWRKARQEAEAVLLHEIGHYRHGDTLFIGAGSLLEYVIQYWFPLNVIFSFLPFVVGLVLEQRDVLDSTRRLQLPLGQTMLFLVQQLFTMDLPFVGLNFLRSLFWSGALFILLGAGIWCAELNADRFVMDAGGSEALLIKVMEQPGRRESRLRWLLAGMNHPPRGMRLWIAKQSQGLGGWLALLLLFPIAFLARWVFLELWQLSLTLIDLYSGRSLGDILWGVVGTTHTYFASNAWLWLLVASILAVWPTLSGIWERLFSRRKGEPSGVGYGVYLCSAGLVCCLCLLGLVPVPPVKPLPVPLGPFIPGDQVRVADTWIVNVGKIGTSSGYYGVIRPEAGHVYLEIAVSLKNISTQDQKLSSGLQFSLHDLANHAYPDTDLAPVHPPEMYAADNTIRAGATVQGQLTYDVPATIHQYILSFKADWKSSYPKTDNEVFWNINLPPGTIPGQPSPIATPSQSLTPSPGAGTPAPASLYPVLKQSYTGAVVNTTYTPATSAPVTIEILSQDGQGNFSGYMLISPPLEGGGPFKGQVGRDDSLHFTVVPDKGSQYTSIDFQGKVQPDGTLKGTYMLPGTTQTGTWEVSPVSLAQHERPCC